MVDIRFTEVSKKYRIRGAGEGKLSLKQRLAGSRFRSSEFWALRNVSFDVSRGQALGIIGPNGAGKSTVLKLLSSITTPTSGEIAIRGRLSALIEVGSGFHPELSGKENIFLSGSILGMRRREIADKLESIVEFAGVDQFIDTPVKRYSSGMYVRLGFSIAAHLDPDILLLDEVLAVGDAAFQSKCFSRITELQSAGKTIVFISHDLTAVELLCDRVLLLDRGRVIEAGEPRDIIVIYQRRSSAIQPLLEIQSGDSSKPIRATRLACTDERGKELIACRRGDPLCVLIEFDSRAQLRDLVFNVFFYSSDNRFHGKLTTATGPNEIDLEAGSGFVEFSCPELRLPAGLYYLDATVTCRGGQEIEWRSRCATLLVEAEQSSRRNGGLACEWRTVQPRPRSAKQLNTVALSDNDSQVEMKGLC